MTRGQNISRAGILNRQLVLHHIRARGAVSCTELAHMTDLSRPAIFKMVNELLDGGWIAGKRLRDGSLGQPTSYLSINPESAYSLGFHLTRNHVSFAAIDFGGDVRETMHFDLRADHLPSVRRTVDECLRRLLREQKFPLEKIVGVGLSTPVDVADADDMPHGPFGSRGEIDNDIRALMNLSVTRDDDATAAAMAETNFGAGLTEDTFLYLYLGRGLEGRLIANRRYLRPGRTQVGDWGGLPQVNPFRSRQTSLGQTLGGVVSAAGLRKSMRAADIAVHKIEDLDQSDAKVRSVTTAWLSDVADLLYLPLLSAIFTLGLKTVFIGGDLPPELVEDLSFEISKRLSMNIGGNWPDRIVRPGKFTRNGAAIGAAALPFVRLWDHGLVT